MLHYYAINFCYMYTILFNDSFWYVILGPLCVIYVLSIMKVIFAFQSPNFTNTAEEN